MKKSIIMTMSVISMLSLVSCGNSGGSSDVEFKPSLDRDTKCEIYIVGEYSSFESLETEFDSFNEYYPNVELHYEKVDKYNSTIATTLDRVNHRPNIFFAYTSYTVDKNMSAVVDHMEKLSDPNLKINLDCLRSGLINRNDKNEVYMVPVFARTYGMLVNTDLFAKEDLSIPKTWSELLTTCEAFADKGYESPMMGYSTGSSNCLMNTVVYPAVVANLANNPEALAKANSLDPSAGEYLRDALNKLDQLISGKPIDIDACKGIKDNYKQTLFRFFKGDVPMMICHADTASGKKYEGQSEDYSDNPFNYSYMPIPMSEQGGYFIDSPSIEFAVNKECDNLDMTNEFMRFLINKDVLLRMSAAKRLVAPTKDVSQDTFYANFHQTPKNRTFLTEAIGIKDPLATQIKIAAFKVGNGVLTVDEAVKQFGTLTE